jgi:hypothetical protein
MQTEPAAAVAVDNRDDTHVADVTPALGATTPASSHGRSGGASGLIRKLSSALHGDKYLIDPSGRGWHNVAGAPAGDRGSVPTAVHPDASPTRHAGPAITTNRER